VVYLYGGMSPATSPKKKLLRPVSKKSSETLASNLLIYVRPAFRIIIEIFINIENLEQASDYFLFLCFKSKAP
jgi:hypothetical protein